MDFIIGNHKYKFKDCLKKYLENVEKIYIK